MTISKSAIGNYNPILQKTNKISAKKNTQIDTHLKVTTEEKKFFTKLYPNEEDQIINYHFYNNKGDKNGNSLGSLFDKRG